MTSSPPIAALQRLAEQWIRARPIMGPLPFVPRDVPAELVGAITQRRPYRTQALADARIWLGMPTMTGIGLQVAVVEPVRIAPFEDWAESISPFPIKLRWSRTMDAGFTDEGTAVLHRIAFEDGQWRVVTFFNNTDRDELLALNAQFQKSNR
jgi:hypothetical protein